MKYLIYDRGDVFVPVIFPELINHDTISAKVSGSVVSAGFCSVKNNLDKNQNEWFVWGKSVSLGISSRPEDAQIITTMMNLRV
jgi:hypothetical protein